MAEKVSQAPAHGSLEARANTQGFCLHPWLVGAPGVPGLTLPCPLRWHVISPYLQLLLQEVPHDCFISQGVHTPFLPSFPSVLVEGDPQQGSGRIGLCAEPGPTVAVPSRSLLGMSAACAHQVERGCAGGRQEGRASLGAFAENHKSIQIPQPNDSTPGNCFPSSNSREEGKTHGLFIAMLFITRRKWKQRPLPEMEGRLRPPRVGLCGGMSRGSSRPRARAGRAVCPAARGLRRSFVRTVCVATDNKDTQNWK